ncbi:MAG: hypothetical protein LAO31_06170 [Acidobacteriia bacterium]|nr:hypothetical protein [Terriglobia bacterium]
MNSLLTIALAFSLQQPCVCPQSIGADAGAPPLAFVPGSASYPGIVACGYLDGRKNNLTRASEFEVFSCKNTDPLLTFDALQTALIQSVGDHLIITEITRAPFGKNWQWIDVPVWRYVVTRSHTPQISKVLVLTPPSLTEALISEALALYQRALTLSTESKDYGDTIDEVAGRLTAAALSGNAKAQAALWHVEKMPFEAGHCSEIWSGYVDLYQTYAKETGKVPLLK